MLKTIPKDNNFLVKHFDKILLLTGLIVVAVYNYHLWSRDKKLIRQVQFRNQNMPRLNRFPKVSAIVAAWNEQKYIDQHIGSFLALDYPGIELILCAGGTDDTFKIAARYLDKRLTLLKQYPGEGKQTALGRCLDLASGEVIYLTDADCLFSKEALIRLLAPVVNQGESVVSGTSRPFDEQMSKSIPFNIWVAYMSLSARTPKYVEGIMGRNSVITRAALDSIGGLKFEARIGTDYQLAKRLIKSGFAIRYVGESILASNYPTSFKAYQQRQSRWLRNLLVYGRRFGAKEDVYSAGRTMVTGIVMLLAPFTSILLGTWVCIIWSLLLFHAFLSRVRYALFTKRIYCFTLSVTHFLTIIPLLLIDFVVWASTAFDLISPRKREKW